MHSLLCAGDMLDLLKWRVHPERISDSLSKLKEIDGSEIVKVDYTAITKNSKLEYVNILSILSDMFASPFPKQLSCNILPGLCVITGPDHTLPYWSHFEGPVKAKSHLFFLICFLNFGLRSSNISLTSWKCIAR